MKKQLKKAVALLTAGVLLSTSAVVYAAQLPPAPTPAEAALTSSQEQLGLRFEVDSYTLTETEFDVTFRMSSTNGYQFRAAKSKITVLAQTADGSWEQVYFDESANGGNPNEIQVNVPVNLKKGQKVEVFIEGTGEAFNGYYYVGSAYGSDYFDFTL